MVEKVKARPVLAHQPGPHRKEGLISKPMSSIAQETQDVSHLDIRMKVCPVCGKEFYVPDSSKWVYQRRGHLFFHSWGCLRKYDEDPSKYKEERSQPMNNRMEIARQLGEAVDKGENPTKFLKDLGYKNPQQALTDLRRLAKEKDPELYEKIRSKKTEQQTEKEPETKSINAGPGDGDDEEWQRWVPDPEPEEPVKITKPVTFEGFPVCGVKGRFARYDTSTTSSGQWLDVNFDNGDCISLTVPDWREFLTELNRAAKILGVEL